VDKRRVKAKKNKILRPRLSSEQHLDLFFMYMTQHRCNCL